MATRFCTCKLWEPLTEIWVKVVSEWESEVGREGERECMHVQGGYGIWQCPPSIRDDVYKVSLSILNSLLCLIFTLLTTPSVSQLARPFSSFVFRSGCQWGQGMYSVLRILWVPQVWPLYKWLKLQCTLGICFQSTATRETPSSMKKKIPNV